MVRRSGASHREATQKAGAQGRHDRAGPPSKTPGGDQPLPYEDTPEQIRSGLPSVPIPLRAPFHEV
jgi:hypothetical protein